MITSNSPYPLKELFPHKDFNKLKKQCAFHFYIVHDQTEKTFEWIKKQPLATLQRPDPIYGLTPLHLAVIKGNLKMAEFLLEKGVSLTAVDKRHYTILHHATITQNDVMLQWINTADKTAKLQPMKMIEGKTADNLKQILSYRPADANQPVFNYLDQDSEEIVYQADATKFQELTNSLYSDHVLATPKALVRNWLSELKLEDDQISISRTAYLTGQYAEFKDKQPVLYIAKNPIPAIGYDVHAGEDIEPYQIVTAYGSSLIEDLPENGSYLMENRDGMNVRNLGPMINDGFPNIACITLPLDNEAGFSYLLISTRKIEKGERLTYDYGLNHASKWDRHTELNSEDLERTFRSQSLDKHFEEIIKQFEKFNKDPKDGLSALIASIQLSSLAYLVNTPSTLFLLLAKEIISPYECLEFFSKPRVSALGNTDLVSVLVSIFHRAQKIMEAKELSNQFNELILNSLQNYRTQTTIYLLHLLSNIAIDDNTWIEHSKQLSKTIECVDVIFENLRDGATKLPAVRNGLILEALNQVPAEYQGILVKKLLADLKDPSPVEYELIYEAFGKYI